MRASNELPGTSLRLSRWLTRRQMEDGLVLAAGCLAAFCGFDPGAAVLVAAWWSVVIVIVRSDIEYQLIPDWTCGAIVLLALLRVLNTPHGPAGLSMALGFIGGGALRAATAFGCLWMVGWIYERISGREGLGFGDVKLGAAIAFWLPLHALLLAFELATSTALVLVAGYRLIRRATIGGSAIPFGAFLAPAAWIIYVSEPFGERFCPWHVIFG